MKQSVSKVAGVQPAQDPRPVSRGHNLQAEFVGLRSLYLVVEYPHADIFERWMLELTDPEDVRLHGGSQLATAALDYPAHSAEILVIQGTSFLIQSRQPPEDEVHIDIRP